MAILPLRYLPRQNGGSEMKAKTSSQKNFVLQKVQPALLGLMDGAVSTLAPIFAVAGLTGKPENAFFVGLAASLGAGVSMGLAEALSRSRAAEPERLGSLKNLAHVDTSVALSVRLAGSVTDQATFRRELTKLVNRGHSMPCRQHNELFDATAELPYPNSATAFQNEPLSADRGLQQKNTRA
jgi:hypothetical protein